MAPIIIFKEEDSVMERHAQYIISINLPRIQLTGILLGIAKLRNITAATRSRTIAFYKILTPAKALGRAPGKHAAVAAGHRPPRSYRDGSLARR